MDHHVKQAPVQGVTGLWGGTQGALTSGASSDPVYVDDVFSTYLYYGNCPDNNPNTTQTITNGIDLDGEGGLVWLKHRTGLLGSASHAMVDTERGVNKTLYPNLTQAQDTYNSVNAFNSNGFQLKGQGNGGSTNYGEGSTTTAKYSSWTFRKCSKFFDIQEYSSGSSNTSGSIGNPNFQVNHDLGCIPGMILIKRTNAVTNWFVWIRGKEGTLNSTGSLGDASALPISNVTSTYIKFAAGNGLYNDPGNFIAYLFGGGPSTASTAKALKFDNDVDALEIASSSEFGTGTGAFTWEAWVKPADNPTYNPFWLVSADGTGTDGGLLIAKQGGFKVKAAGGTNYLSLDPPPVGVWTHFAVCRSGSTIKAFYNGLEQKSNTCTESFASGKAYIGYTGSNAAQTYNGLISNVRWIKGTALYTSSFTPPTEPLTNVTNTKLLCCNSSTVTGSTVTPTTISQKSGSNITVAYAGDTPFDDPDGFAFGEDEDQNIVSTGRYTGNGSSTAPPVINIGWEPQWLMVKHLSGQDWVMVDSMRGMGVGLSDTPHLRANSTNNEQDTSYYRIDISSANGFAPHTTDNGLNADGSEYVYIAFRRPDGYVGKPITAGTDAFATDTAAATVPNFDSGFPVDWTFIRTPASNSNWYASARLISGKLLQPNITAAQGSHSEMGFFDFNEAYGGGGWWDANVNQAWMWGRHAGFDVVCYSGNGANRDVRHSMGIAPTMIWLKSRTSTEAWVVGSSGLSSWAEYLTLNNNDGESTNAGIFNSTAPTATHFSLGTQNRSNENNNDYIAFLFASVSGVSSVGTYTGNGQTGSSGTFVTTGFQPRLVWVKRFDGHGQDWPIYDSLRGFNANTLYLNELDAAEAVATAVEVSSTGFRLITNNANTNNNTDEYIYYAHA